MHSQDLDPSTTYVHTSHPYLLTQYKKSIKHQEASETHVIILPTTYTHIILYHISCHTPISKSNSKLFSYLIFESDL